MADEFLNASNFKGEEVMLDVESIVVSKDLQQRDLTDQHAAKEYKLAVHDVVEAVQSKESIERVFVIRIPEGTNRVLDGSPVQAGLYLVEGFRRLAGFKAAGRAKIPALVRDGTWEEAVDVSTSANVANLSLPRKPADKRRAVLTSLTNHWDWSDREHARHCRVGQELVSKCRPEAEKFLRSFAKESPNGSAVLEKLDSKTRVGKGGKRQAAKKAKARKEVKIIDWSEWEGPWGRLVRFVDYVGEMTLSEDERKKASTDYQKTHAILKALGSRLKAWAAKKPKVVA
jgi:hypothetical protein